MFVRCQSQAHIKEGFGIKKDIQPQNFAVNIHMGSNLGSMCPTQGSIRRIMFYI